MIGLLGLFIILAGWVVLTFPVQKTDQYGTYTEGLVIKSSVLPSPQSILAAYPRMWKEQKLVSNVVFSLELNLAGYLLAILICIPLGFLIGLTPFFKHLILMYVNVLRFVPLVAAGPIFGAWFPNDPFWMKINFLAVGIGLYLLPTIVLRISEVEKVYEDTLWTLGASSWQTFKKVYFPYVMSKIWSDIMVLTAISWTYISFIEMYSNQGGVGAMLYAAKRNTAADVFALFFLIILIGFLQDRIFRWADRRMFKFKYVDSK